MHMHARGRLRALEHFTNFAAAETFLRLQQNCGTLLRRQLRERGTKPPYRLLQHRVVLGTGLTRRRIERAFVGIVAAGSRKRRESLPPSILALMVDAQIDQYPVEPGRKARTTVEAPGRFVQPDERVL